MKSIKIFLLVSMMIITGSTIFGTDITSRDGKISIELENVDIVMALNMIARQNDLNLILTPDIKGDISIRLIDVDVETALDAILLPNGFSYAKRDNIITVSSEDRESNENFVSEIITLRYANPVSVKLALEAVKSKQGKVVILDKVDEESASTRRGQYSPNKIFISDLPGVYDKMNIVIDKMDIPEKSISITVKIIETKIDSLTRLGLNWPATMSSSIGDNTSSESTDITTDETSSGSMATLNLNNGNWSWGTLSISQLTTVLDMLEQQGNSKLISYPNVTTLENHEAEIKSEIVIPIPTINRFTEAAATQDIMTFEDEEVGISLRVTPRINKNDNITLDVIAKVEDIIGYTGTTDARKPITTLRSITTRTTVKNGETAALGGLLKEDVISSKQRIPILGHIPLLGKLLFTTSSEEKTTTDLIILITPSIVK